MSDPMPLTQLDERSRRLLPLVTVGPYVLLAILAVFTVGDQARRRRLPGSSTWPCARLAAAWMLWMFTLHPAWRERPRLMAVFFAGLIVIMAVLVIRDPWFGFFTPAGYLYAFAVLRWPWRLRRRRPRWPSWRPPRRRTACTGPARLGVLVYAGRRSPSTCVPMCGLAWFGLEQRRAGRAARAGPRRAERGQPQAGGDAGRERGPARAAADPGPGGRRPRRAAADGARDPRHPGPGPDRDHHPAPGGRAGQRGTRRAGAAPVAPRPGWPGRACPRPGGRCTRCVPSRWRRRG